MQERFPHVKVRVAQPLVDELGDNDLRLAHLLADNVRDRLRPGSKPHVALVDHGSPIPEVTAVRNRLAGQLSVLLGNDVACVAATSMERRQGDEYRFNEPLLENLLVAPELKFRASYLGDAVSFCRVATLGRAAISPRFAWPLNSSIQGFRLLRPNW